MHPIRAVLFDLDGTLIDTAGEISLALERTFRELNLPPLSKNSVEKLIGRGIASMVQRALAQAGSVDFELTSAIGRFDAHYAQTVATIAELYPGVRAGLDLLRAHAIPLGVVTNKPRHFTERLLDCLQIRPAFAAVVAGDDGLRRKPHGDMLLAACAQLTAPAEDTLMIGDSANDVDAARAAGCHVWCVPYGYNEGRPAQTLACDRAIATVVEAARLVVMTR